MRGRILLAIALLALAARLIYLYQLDGDPLLGVLMGDARVYDEWAQRLAAGQWLGTEVFYQTPLYPYALGVVFAIAGHRLATVRVIQALLGAVSCVLLGRAGRRWFGDRAGIAAALLLAVYPPAIFFDGLIQKSSLDIFLVTALLALLAEFEARRDWKWLLAAGVCLGTLVLNRENAFIWGPVIAGWTLLGFRDVPLRRRAAWAAIFVGAAFVVLLPVAIRNQRVGGEFVLSTAQLGPNLYIGNNPHASGSYESLLPGRGDPIYERADATALASKALGRPLSPGEVSGYWTRKALAFIGAEPARALKLFGKKLLLTVNAAEIPDTESIEAYAGSSGMLRALLWLDFGVILPLAAIGAWVHRRQWRQFTLLYTLAGSMVLAVAAFFVVARYRHPLVPIVLLFSGAGLAGLGEIRRAHRAWIPIVAAALVAVMAHVPIKVVHDQTYINLGAFLVRSGRMAEAVPVLRKAVVEDPDDPAAHLQLGLAYRETGEARAALDEMNAALRLRPDYGEAHGALGLLLRDMGQPAEALPHFKEGARLLPQSAEMHSNLGLALLEAGQIDAAVAEHRLAVQLAPDTAGPHNNLAVGLQQAGRTKEAIEEYRVALRIKPDDPEAAGNLGLALASTGDYEAALRQFDIALGLARAAGRADMIEQLNGVIAQTKATLARRPSNPRASGRSPG